MKPELNINGLDGNIFSVMGAASRVLKHEGFHDQAKEMIERVFQCGSYHEALNVIGEYVEYVSE